MTPQPPTDKPAVLVGKGNTYVNLGVLIVLLYAVHRFSSHATRVEASMEHINAVFKDHETRIRALEHTQTGRNR